MSPGVRDAACASPHGTPAREAPALARDAARCGAGEAVACGAHPADVVGVLQRHVSLLNGFRPRLFALRDGTLTCYKTSGDAKIGLLELLRDRAPEQRTLCPGWTAAVAAAAESARAALPSPAPPSPSPVVKHVVALQHCAVRVSATDARRLFLRVPPAGGVAEWELRAESRAERDAWADALAAHAAAAAAAAAAAVAAASPEPPRTPPHKPRGSGGEESEGGSVQRQHAPDAKLLAAAAAAAAALDGALAAGGCAPEAAAAARDALAALASAAHGRLEAAARRRRRLRARMRTLRADRAALEREVLRSRALCADADGAATPMTPPPPPPASPPHWLSRWRSLGTPRTGEPDAGGRSPLAEMGTSGGEATSPLPRSRSLSHAWRAPRSADATDCADDAFSARRGRFRSDSDASSDSDHDASSSSSASVDDVAGRHVALSFDTASEDEEWFEAAPAATPPRRSALPPAAEAAPPASLWALLREGLGRDLTRLCLPVTFNEPLSALQKLAEEFEHSTLLDAAAAAPRGSVKRHALVAAFAVAAYAGSAHRGLKPFNPLERETYALVAPERRLRFIAEKARHHPPALAWHAASYDDVADDGDDGAPPPRHPPRWEAWGAAALTPRFTGRRLELRPSGGTAVRFYGGGTDGGTDDVAETFTWSKVTTLVGNLILGPLCVAHAGTMRVRSDVTGAVWTLRFRDVAPPAGAAAGGINAAACAAAAAAAPPCVAGALEPGGAEISGTWWGSLTWQEGPAGCSARSPLWARGGGGGGAGGRAGEVYRWSAFVAGLNQLPAAPADVAALPPTDSRLRPDQRLLEEGRYAAANAAKQRLEHKQRAARARATAPPPPRWFRPAPPPRDVAEDAGGLWYEYAGGYWEAAAAADWGDAPRIFD